MKIMKKVLALVLALAILSVPMVASAAKGDAVPVPSTDYCIISGDTVTVPAGQTIFFEISTEWTTDTYDFVVEGEGNFSVSVCTEDGAGAYIDGPSVDAVDGKVETQITGYESTYCYGCFSITNNSDADANYTCTIVFPVGSQSNPANITLTVGGTAQITVAAGTQYYISVALPARYTDYQLTITGESQFGLSSGYGMPTWDTDGTIVTTAGAYRTSTYTTSIVNNSASEQIYTLELDNMPLGSSSNPEALTLGTTTKALVDEEYYYSWTATEAGTFKLEIDTAACADGWTYNLNNGYTTYNFSTGWGEADKYISYIPVAEGDTISLSVSVPSPSDVYDFASGSVTFNTAFSAVAGDGDCDGTVETEDLVAIRKALLKKANINLSNPGNYDVNGDGKCNVRDLVSLKSQLAAVTE